MTQITSPRKHDADVRGSSDPAKVQRDIPMPSVEDGRAFSGASASSHSTEGHYRFRTPSVSVSPPPSARDGRGKAGNAQSLEQRPLASLADLTTAIDDVRTNPRYPEAGSSRLNPAHTYAAPGRPTSPRPKSTRSRRSSSRSPRHDVTSEEPPQDAFYDENFQQAYMRTKRLVRDLSSALGSSTLHQELDSAMGKLYDTSVRLADFQHPTNSMVGFVGDSGVGKSSLINSLLDKAGLVRASNSGGACTCVATEFHYREQSTFSIEVDLFNENELLEQLSQMAESYHRFYLSENGIDDDTDRKELEERANLASDTLHSMFRSRLGDIDSLLVRPNEEIISTFRSWISELKPSMACDTHAGLSQEDCSAMLRQLSSEPDSESQPAAWPYIRKIRVFLNAHILSNGLILVDLPGLRDMNTARRNVTERFIRECDEIFVVCHIGRAVTDKSVDSVFKLAEKAELSNVGIICTKSDDIIPDEAVIDLAAQDTNRINQLLDAINTKKNELLELTSDLEIYAEEDDLDADEKEYRYQISVRKDNAERDLKGLELELKTRLVRTRNESVTRRLRSEYNGRHLGDGDVKIFCVSNTLYNDNREGTSNVTHRYLDLSGIIELRRYCISIVSGKQHSAATRYMRDSVPSLLADVELWVQSGISRLASDRRKKVRDAISEIEKRLFDLLGSSAPVQNMRLPMTRSFRNRIYDFSAGYIHAWSEAAQEAGFEWSGWHHSTYSAFCRKSGCHCTTAVGQRDWNEEVIARMVEDLRGPWTNLEGDIRLLKNEAVTSVSALTDWAIRTVENELKNDVSTFISLRRALVTHQHLLEHGIENAFEQAVADLRKLRVDAFTGLQTSFIGVAMEPKYRACRHEGGTGSHARRKKIIETTLSEEQLFLDIMRKLQDGYHVVANSVQSLIRGSVDTNLSHILSTLNLVRDENVALESQRDSEFNEKVHEAVKVANSCIHGIHEKLGI